MLQLPAMPVTWAWSEFKKKKILSSGSIKVVHEVCLSLEGFECTTCHSNDVYNLSISHTFILEIRD